MPELPLEISTTEVNGWLAKGKDFLLLDCREQFEYDLVHIEQSMLLPMSEMQQRKEELTGQEEGHVVVYCHHGMRSAQVTVWLREQGFSRAQSMAGGIDAWAQDVDPNMTRY